MTVLVNGSELSGLTSIEVNERLVKYGKNEFTSAKKPNPFVLFLKTFLNPLVILLLLTAVVALTVAVVGIFTSRKSTSTAEMLTDLLSPILIILLVITNNIIDVVSELKCQHSVDSLKKISFVKTRVLRDCKISEISANELVVDDIIFLEAGNKITADAILLEANRLQVDESVLTGESELVDKLAHVSFANTNTRQNYLYSGCSIVNGTAVARVTATGFNSEIGKIQKLINEQQAPKTHLQIKLDKLSKILTLVGFLLFAFMLIVEIAINHTNLQSEQTWTDMLLSSVAFSVAVIPEGIVVCISVVLAIGMNKMAKKNAIIKNFDVIESLGSISVICSDKTGTLTQNKMSVVRVWTPHAGASEVYQNKYYDLISQSVLCTEAHISVDENHNLVEVGDPTETALLKFGFQNNIIKSQLLQTYPLIFSVPFDSERKMSTTVHQISSDQYLVVTKGAPENVLKHCADPTDASRVLDIVTEWAQSAYRVLAVATKIINGDIKIAMEDVARFSADLEMDLVLSGLIALFDIPRNEAFGSIEACHSAGIKPCMITGDNLHTGCSVAKMLKIFNHGDLAISGDELDKISEDKFVQIVSHYSVYARVKPIDKLRIVNAWQKTGHAVVMTGDGVNDAPALKAANVGCAMGISGTEVAKESASVILMDDNFATIVESIRLGRNIQQKIKRMAANIFLFSISEVIVMFVGMMLVNLIPAYRVDNRQDLNVFNAIQLLWLNLVAHGFLSIVTGFQENRKNYMNALVWEQNKDLFGKKMWIGVTWRSFVIAFFTLVSYVVVRSGFPNLSSPQTASASAFTTMSTTLAISTLSIVSDSSIFKCSFGFYKWVYISIIIIFCFSFLLVFTPGVSSVFGFGDKFTSSQYCYVIFIAFAIGLGPTVVEEIYRVFQRK